VDFGAISFRTWPVSTASGHRSRHVTLGSGSPYAGSLAISSSKIRILGSVPGQERAPLLEGLQDREGPLEMGQRFLRFDLRHARERNG